MVKDMAPRSSLSRNLFINSHNKKDRSTLEKKERKKEKSKKQNEEDTMA